MVKQLAAVVAALALVAQMLPGQFVYAENGEHEHEHEDEVIICHLPPGNPGNPQTLEISEDAVSAHLGHGDTLGACGSQESESDHDHDNEDEVVVSGYKFNDLSGEGLWNEGESALAGWTITAYTAADHNTAVASDVTDTNGYYELLLEDWNTSQVFFVAETMQSGWKQTLPGAFSNYEYQLGPNQGREFVNVNFGNTLHVESCNGSELVINGSFEDTVVTHPSLWDTFMNGALGLVWKVLRRDGSPSDKGLEIQRGYSGWLAADGQQFAELDGYHPVKIFQDIDTQPGKMYKISLAFSPRPNTPAVENAVHVTWGGSPIADVAADSVVTTQTTWQTYTYWVPATAETMELALADAGATADSLGTFIDDVSVTCTARNGRALTGTKFNDANGNGVWNEGEAGLADWMIYTAKPIGSFTIDAAGTPALSPIFEDGVDYIVRVKGTINAGDDITADAMYSVRTPSTTWTDSVQTYEANGPTLLDVQIDGVSPYWGDYTDAHAYFTPIHGTGSAKTFTVNDIFPANNTGSFFVSIYQVVDSGLTDANGKYYIEASDWQGEHPVVIMEQTWKPGWSQSFPGGDHDFLHYVPWDIAWANDWAYDFGNHQISENPDDTSDQPQTGSLKVTVQVVNDNDGTSVPGDFNVLVTDVDGSETVNGNASGVTVTNVTGAYTAALTGATSSYTVTYSSDCVGTMTTDALKDCVVSLDDIAKEQVSSKVVPTVSCIDTLPNGLFAARFGYNNHAGETVSLAAGSFENRMVGGGLSGQAHGQPTDFLSGNHPDAFAVIFNGGIDLTWTVVSLDSNAVTVNSESPKCETSLDYPTITLEKILNNNDILDYTLNDFTFKIDGQIVTLGQPTIVSASTAHTLTEEYDAELEAGAVSDDYTITFSENCAAGTMTLALGDDATCTITNVAKINDGQGGGDFVDQAEPSGNSGGGGGGGSGGGGGGARQVSNTSPTVNHDPAGPIGVVLGDSDEADSSVDAPVLEPVILGVQDTLPRTGMPVAVVLLFGSVFAWSVTRRQK